MLLIIILGTLQTPRIIGTIFFWIFELILRGNEPLLVLASFFIGYIVFIWVAKEQINDYFGYRDDIYLIKREKIPNKSIIFIYIVIVIILSYSETLYSILIAKNSYDYLLFYNIIFPIVLFFGGIYSLELFWQVYLFNILCGRLSERAGMVINSILFGLYFGIVPKEMHIDVNFGIEGIALSPFRFLLFFLIRYFSSLIYSSYNNLYLNLIFNYLCYIIYTLISYAFIKLQTNYFISWY
jgi:membrane protease YdiL (CAAX protease family)